MSSKRFILIAIIAVCVMGMSLSAHSQDIRWGTPAPQATTGGEIRVPVQPTVREPAPPPRQASGMTLGEAVAIALENNPNVELAVVAHDIARVTYYMTHEASGTPTGGGGEPPGFPIELLLGGSLQSLVDQTRSQLRVAGWAVDHTRAMIRVQAEAAFFAVLRAIRMAAVAKEALETSQRHLELAQQMKGAGLVSDVDVLDARAAVANAGVSVSAADVGVRLAVASFNMVLGRALDEQAELDDMLDEIPQPPDPPELARLEERASRDRFEVRQAEENRKRSQSALDSFSGDRSSWSYSLSELQLSQAELELAQKREEVRMDVRQRWADLFNSHVRVEANRLALAVAAEKLRLAELRYEGGLTTALELSMARLGYTQASSALIDAYYDHQVARARLRATSGGK